jgi:hypothetical protein
MKHLRNILTHTTPQNYKNGIDWYNDAQQFSQEISVKYNVSTELVASVIAALSPRNRWARNKIDAENVISHIYNRQELPKVSTYGNMLRKSLKLCDNNLTHEQRIKILNGRKIQSFYSNIIGDDSMVTVDTWMDLAHSGKYKAVKKRKGLTLTRYKKIESDIQKLAKEEGIKSYQMQAIIWVQFQQNVKGKSK